MYNLQVAKLVIYNSQKSRSLVSCFVTQPKIGEKERGGQIFVISEIQKTTSEYTYQKLIDSLIKSMKGYYYNEINYRAGPIELVFEAALQKTNQELGFYLTNKENGINDDFLNNLNVLVGVARNHEIHFSLAGDIKGYLIRKNKISDIVAGPEKLQGQHQESQKINPLKVFSHVISGHLETDDGILFCTESLLDYFSLEKLKKIIADNQASKVCQNLQDLLIEIDDKSALAAIALKLLATPQIEKKGLSYPPHHPEEKGFPALLKKSEKNSVQDSIAKLLDQQTETNQIISPRLVSNLKKIFTSKHTRQKKSKTSQEKTMFRTIKNYSPTNNLPKIKHFPGYKITHKFGSILKIAAVPFELLGKFFKKNPARFDKLSTSSLEKISSQARTPKKYLRRLPLSSKALLFVCIILGLLFIQSIFLLNKRRDNQQDIQTYNQLLEQVETMQNETEASLIYSDEEKARLLLKNILELIAGLPQNTEERAEKASTLLAKANAQLNQLNRLRTIKNPKQLLDFSALTFFAEELPSEIIKLQKNIYTYRSRDNSFYVINLGTGEIDNLQNSSGEIGKITKIKKFDESSFLLYHNLEGVAKFDTKKNTIISFGLSSREDIIIADVAAYNNQLYVLAPNKNLILKYSPVAGSFSRETEWLKDGTDIREAISFIIDSSLWILKADGSVINLMKGVEAEFTRPTIEPLLIGPTKIWTDADSKNLYILDSPSKRIVIITKEGILKEQLTSKSFADLKDFVVDEEAGKIYVLAGAKIYEVDLGLE
ncbi:hypothetical protein KKD19_01550 [Patescibacteria group bacterium]|nr:hypothetical protein [Patescibacteria group bacterium]MBU4511915.1 hypothetical protein [Patescibacteria group bacterium]MCG2692883.1 hypothetical protein [Candidatus Parcubacteria bacterium]